MGLSLSGEPTRRRRTKGLTDTRRQTDGVGDEISRHLRDRHHAAAEALHDAEQQQQRIVAQGISLWEAKQQAIQWVGQQVQAQSSYLGYMDAFLVLMLISLAAVPLALTLRKVKLSGAAPMGH